MSDEILASVYSERSKHSALSKMTGATKMYSSILPTPPSGESFPTTYDIVAIDESSQAKAGSVFVHKMPTNHWTVDSFLVVRMNATSAGVSAPRVGGNIITRIVVRNGDNIEEYDYQTVMSYVLSRSTPAERAQVLSALGGASAAAETIIVPLLSFWTPLGSGSPAKNNVGFPNFLVNTGIEIEITMAPITSLVSAGGAFAVNAYDTVKVVHLQKKAATSVYQSVRAAGNWNLWTYDYQTSSTRFTLANGAQTRCDVSHFDGSSSGLFISPLATTSITANDLYAHASGISSIVTELNGAPYLRVSTNIDATTSERVLDWLSYTFAGAGQDGGDATLSHNTRFVPFGAALTAGRGDEGSDNQVANVSGANLRDFTQKDLLVTNSSGAEMQIGVMNIRYANYFIRDGSLFRTK